MVSIFLLRFPSILPQLTARLLKMRANQMQCWLSSPGRGVGGGGVDCYFILTFRNLSRGTIFLIVGRVVGMWESVIPLNLGPLPNLIIQIYSQYFHLQHSRFPHLRVRFYSVFHYKATFSRTQHEAWFSYVSFHANSQRNKKKSLPEKWLTGTVTQSYRYFWTPL
jgi:hypothetical protein